LQREETSDLHTSPRVTTVVATRKTKWARNTRSTEVDLQKIECKIMECLHND